MTLREVIRLLDGEVILSAGDMDSDVSTVCSSDLMSDLLCFATKPRSLLITGLVNPQVVRTAEIADLKAIIFVLDKRPDKETIELAREKDIPLIATRFSRFTSCGILYAKGLQSCTEDATL
ncbi:MAG TPA: hypothetical protein VFG09_12270 [Thermodesulfovibrionales bacterium]|jgi:predicted transcriptional regulator|nr:hypothetical protein [Thermodesulfovibrionales bacterium]